jgi:hypothetical protein
MQIKANLKSQKRSSLENEQPKNQPAGRKSGHNYKLLNDRK